MNAFRRFHSLLLLIAFSLFFTPGFAQSTLSKPKMDTLQLITAQPFSVRVLASGQDITAKFGIKTAKYNADGTGTRELLDGQRIDGTWKFLNPEKTEVEVSALGQATQWRIVELNENVYRKVLLSNPAVEFVQTPLRP